jgi:hypothetical protein
MSITDAGTSCYQLDRLTLFGTPDEPAADRTSYVQTIAATRRYRRQS